MDDPDRGAPDFDALFEAHHQRVYRAAFRVTGSHADAEDVLQSVFVRLVQAYRASGRVPWNANAGAYLGRSAINAALDLLRKRDREVAETAASEPETAPEAALVDRQSEEIAVRLRAALAHINPRAAEMFVLRYFEEYENQMIAEMLGTSVSTVNVTLHRALRSLQGLLTEFEGVIHER